MFLLPDWEAEYTVLTTIFQYTDFVTTCEGWQIFCG